MTPQPGELGRVKGAAFRQFVVWWEQTHGAESVEAALHRVRAKGLGETLTTHREALGILPSTWYPAELVHELLDGLLDGYDDETRQAMAFSAADTVMNATLSGVYRAAFVMLASPPRFAKHIQRMWSMHYDSGDVTIEEGDHIHHTRYENWRSHHPFICQLNVASARPLYSAMGCKNMVIDPVACVSRGDPHCSFTVRWEDGD